MTSLAREIGFQNETTAARRVSVKVPATAGELWQGHVNGRLMMINSPIDFFGEIMVTARSAQESRVQPLVESPLVQKATEMVLQNLKLNASLDVHVVNPIPRALGMASSTTEISAAAFASARAMGLRSGPARSLVHKIVGSLDSGNDGNYETGISLVAPRESVRIASFSEVPSMQVLLVNTGGQVNTAEMDRAKERRVCLDNEKEVQGSLEQLLSGLAVSDCKQIGRAATLNSLVYQQILPKPRFYEVLRLLEDNPHIFGVSVGHSGTLLCLLGRRGYTFGDLTDPLSDLYGRDAIIGNHSLVSGGFHESVSI